MRPYERLGAHLREIDGVKGTAFAVWAPDAQRVSVVGDFNTWDGRRHPMRLRRECGVWELFLPGVGTGACYKYEIRTNEGRVLPLKADPYGFAAELRPSTASVVCNLPQTVKRTSVGAGSKLNSPISIYEVHLSSWRKADDGGFPDWQRISETLIPYAIDLGFTHLELLPISEHPFDGSWGYQPLGLYAPTARFGSPQGFCDFVEASHAAGLEIIVDWVPALSLIHISPNRSSMAARSNTLTHGWSMELLGNFRDQAPTLPFALVEPPSTMANGPNGMLPKPSKRAPMTT